MTNLPPDTVLCHVCGHVAGDDARPGDECPEDGHVLVAADEHARDPNDLILGRTVGDKYPVVGIIGAGGMGTVYRAVQRPVGREVALKVIKYTGSDAQEVQRRFVKEAKVVASLHHPNTVTLFDFGIHGQETLYAVMELLRGRPLSKELALGPIPYRRAAGIIAAVLDALVEAHGLGLVHRDLKPDNVMLVPTTWGTEDVKVLDFGIAKVLAGSEAASAGLTRSGVVFGTPRYMAPEQTAGSAVTPAADQYALGAVLYQCLAGRPPFSSSDVLRLMLAHREDPPPPLPEGLGIPPEVGAVALRALEKDPGARYPGAREMAGALREAAGLLTGDELTGEDTGASDVVASAPPATLPEGSGPVPTPVPVETAPTAFFGQPPVGLQDALGTAPTEAWDEPPPVPRAAGVATAPARPPSGVLRGQVLVAATFAFAALVAGGVGWLVLRSGTGGDAPAAARPHPGTPAEQARLLEAQALQLKDTGRCGEALPRLGAALALDRTRFSAHYHRAACLALAGRRTEVQDALEAYLRAVPEPRALTGRLVLDGDFGRVMEAREFRDWMRAQDLLPATPAPDEKPGRVGKGEGDDEPRARPKRPKRPRTPGTAPPGEEEPKKSTAPGFELPEF